MNKTLPNIVSLAEQNLIFRSSYDGVGPLYATAIYPSIHDQHYPIVVVQHGYSGNRGMVLYSARRIAQHGFFCLCIEMRGRGQSAGMRDDGGIEIMDIYDGIAAAKTNFADIVDNSRVSIIGYSNGGGNVFFANIRFPFLFNASMALFGIPDYGMWYKLSPLEKDRENLRSSIGGSPEDLPDKYLTRNMVIAASNLSGTRFHIAFDEMETRCPNIMSETFYNTAKSKGYENIFLHISKQNDKHRFEHGYNTNGEHSHIEDFFIDDIEKTNLQTPIMPSAGHLVVLGYIITPKFKLFLNNGDDGIANLRYDISNKQVRLILKPITKIKGLRIFMNESEQNKKCSIEIEKE